MKEEKDIEQLFAASFEGFEVRPPGLVKERIDRELNRGRFRIMWWGIGMLLFAVGIIAAWQFSGMSDEDANVRKGKVTTAASGMEEQEIGNPQEVVKKLYGKQTDGGEATQTASTVNASRSAEGNGSYGNEKGIPVNNKMHGVVREKRNKWSGKRGKSDGMPIVGRPTGGDVIPSGSGDAFGSGNSDETEEKLSDNAPAAGNEGDTPDDPEKKALSLPDSSDEAVATANSPNRKKETEEMWRVSLFAGPQLPFNSAQPSGYELKEHIGARISAEWNRQLFAGFGATTGIGYAAAKEKYAYNHTTIDSVYMGIDSIPIYSQQDPDSIIGYNYVEVYDVNETKQTYSSSYKVTTVMVPLYVSRHFSLGDNWGILANAGTVFGFHTITSVSMADTLLPSVTTRKFSMNVSGRVHATYSFGNWMVSAGIAAGWEAKPAIRYGEADRKRYTLTPQIGIHLNF